MRNVSREVKRALNESEEANEYDLLKAKFDRTYQTYLQIKQAFAKYPEFTIKFPNGHNCDAILYTDESESNDSFYELYTSNGEYNVTKVSFGSSTGQRYEDYLGPDEDEEINSLNDFADFLYNQLFGTNENENDEDERYNPNEVDLSRTYPEPDQDVMNKVMYIYKQFKSILNTCTLPKEYLEFFCGAISFRFGENDDDDFDMAEIYFESSDKENLELAGQIITYLRDNNKKMDVVWNLHEAILDDMAKQFSFDEYKADNLLNLITKKFKTRFAKVNYDGVFVWVEPSRASYKYNKFDQMTEKLINAFSDYINFINNNWQEAFEDED